jgi:hypothetical protein
LLKSQPDNPDLQAKLAEVESLAQPAHQMEVPEDPWRERDPWESASAEAVDEKPADNEDAAAWLSGGAAPAESTPTPYAWTEQTADVVMDTGRPIGAYFRELLAWQPRAAAAQVAEQATAAEAFDAWFGAAEPERAEEASTELSQAGSHGDQPATEGQDDDDDDLEMFRSWLQSLKK